MTDVFVLPGRLEDEVFSFEPAGETTCYHFNISALQRWFVDTLNEGGVEALKEAGVMFTVQALPVEWIETNLIPKGNFEEARVQQLVEPHLSAPIFGFIWPDGSTVIPDGNHRLIRHYRDKRPTIKMLIFPESVWRKVQIDLPGRGTLDVEDPRVPNDWRGDYLKSRGVV